MPWLKNHLLMKKQTNAKNGATKKVWDNTLEQLQDQEKCPSEAQIGHFQPNQQADWAFIWTPEQKCSVESYVNLPPTKQGAPC